MYRFDEIKDRLTEMARVRKKVVSVAAAGDKVVLETIKIMNDHGFGRAILVGDADKIKQYAKEVGCDLSENTIVDEKDEKRAAALAVARVRRRGRYFDEGASSDQNLFAGDSEP